jgi:uncharacterized membrane protein YdjX (TVP38/TMEM64 family)
VNHTDHGDGMQLDAAEETGHRRGWSLRRLWPLLLIAAAIAAFFAFDLQRYASLEGLRQHQAEWRAFVQAHYAVAALIYAAIYAAIVLCAIPVGLWLTLIGGFLFGAAAAVPMAVAASTAGATLMFLVARSSFGSLFEAKAGGWLARLEDGFRRDQWSYMFFLRLVPIFPFCTVTVVPALIGVDLLCFMVSTFFGLIPVTVIFALAGASIGDVLDAGTFSVGTVLSPQLISALVGLGVVAILPALVRRLRRRPHS